MKQILHTDKGVNTHLSLTSMCLWRLSVCAPSSSTVVIWSGQWAFYRLHWPEQTVLQTDLVKLVWVLYYVATATIYPVFLENHLFFHLFGRKRTLCHLLSVLGCLMPAQATGSDQALCALEGSWAWQMNSKGAVSLKFQDMLFCLYLHNRFVKLRMHHLHSRRMRCRSMAALDADTSLHAVNIPLLLWVEKLQWMLLLGLPSDSGHTKNLPR